MKGASFHFSPLAFLLAILFSYSSLWADFLQDERGGTRVGQSSFYDFSPTVMLDTDGKYKMWWCGGSIGTSTIDNIYYSEANALTGPWSTPISVFQPSHGSGKFDQDLTCDPSVVRVEGVYYMYYGAARLGGNPPLVQDGGIGLASSVDGINWTRLNNGNPIITAHNFSVAGQEYGAGQPSVIFVDDWYYMLYHDSTGADGGLGYMLRSRGPYFSANTEQLQASGSVHVWVPFNKPTATDHHFLQVVNADLIYHAGFDQVGVAFSGICDVVTTFMYDKTLTTINARENYTRFLELEADWIEGPAIVTTPRGHAIHVPSNVGASDCLFPVDIWFPITTQSNFGCTMPLPIEQVIYNLYELEHAGADWLISAACGAVVNQTPLDYDGERLSGHVVYRRSTQEFLSIQTSAGYVIHQMGTAGSSPIQGDFDGDGITDYGIVNPYLGNLDWFIAFSSGGTYFQTWGYDTDQLAIADYNGDGEDDIGIFRDITGGTNWWYVIDLKDNPTTKTKKKWGVQGDIPVPADYDGDGIADFATWRPSDGFWWILKSTGGSVGIQWGRGANGDIPLTGEFYTNGASDLIVYRTTNGKWYTKAVDGSQQNGYTWGGQAGDVPILGDFDGDGLLDRTVYRPSTGAWVHKYRNNAEKTFVWGLPGDLLPMNKLQ